MYQTSFVVVQNVSKYTYIKIDVSKNDDTSMKQEWKLTMLETHHTNLFEHPILKKGRHAFNHSQPCRHLHG